MAKVAAKFQGGTMRRQTLSGNWEAWRDEAQRCLPRFVFDYLEGGSEEEICLDRNREAFSRWMIVPRVLQASGKTNTKAAIFGCALDAPIALAPIGLCDLFYPGGDLHLARAAAVNKLAYTLSSAANTSCEDIAEACEWPPWFQLYVVHEEHAMFLTDRARAAGCQVLVLTVDAQVGGFRTRDRENKLCVPLRPTWRQLAQMSAHPRWTRRYWAGGRTLSLPHARGSNGSDETSKLLGRTFDIDFDWFGLARLRDRWRGQLVVKGVLNPEDAEKMASLGVDGIVVSNHGGRQIDSAPAPLDVLPAIARAVGQKLDVLIDGGVRTGEDLFKALALGASGVMIGRLPIYGLAAGGEQGCGLVLRMLQEGLLRTMILTGCHTVNDINISHVRLSTC